MKCDVPVTFTRFCQLLFVYAQTAKPSAVRSQRLCLVAPVPLSWAATLGEVKAPTSLPVRHRPSPPTQAGTTPVRPRKNNARAFSLKSKPVALRLRQPSEGKRIQHAHRIAQQ